MNALSNALNINITKILQTYKSVRISCAPEKIIIQLSG